jgi:hypothetical protein
MSSLGTTLGRWIDRVRHRDRDAILGFPCAACGRPAVGWAVATRDHAGVQVIDGSPACEAHLSVPDDEVRESKVG